MELKDTYRAEIRANLRVAPGEAVERIESYGDSTRVFFKRYLKPLDISDNDARLLHRVQNSAISVNELAADQATESVWQHVMRLARQRVVSIEPGSAN